MLLIGFATALACGVARAEDLRFARIAKGSLVRVIGKSGDFCDGRIVHRTIGTIEVRLVNSMALCGPRDIIANLLIHNVLRIRRGRLPAATPLIIAALLVVACNSGRF